MYDYCHYCCYEANSTNPLINFPSFIPIDTKNGCYCKSNILEFREFKVDLIWLYVTFDLTTILQTIILTAILSDGVPGSISPVYI